MNLKKIKMLPLPYYVQYTVEENEVADSHWVVASPRVGRDGWYYDRFSKKSWFEFNDVTYVEPNPEMFLFDLNVVFDTRCFTEREAQAVTFLKGRGQLKGSDPICVALYNFQYRCDLKEIGREVHRSFKHLADEE